jgi:Na+-driven multidrug efflux pump
MTVGIVFKGFWIVNMIAAYVLAFRLDMKLKGIRIALLLALAFNFISFYLLIRKQDIQTISREAQNRVQREVKVLEELKESEN